MEDCGIMNMDEMYNNLRRIQSILYIFKEQLKTKIPYFIFVFYGISNAV